jgi:hypothetical protein
MIGKMFEAIKCFMLVCFCMAILLTILFIQKYLVNYFYSQSYQHHVFSCLEYSQKAW